MADTTPDTPAAVESRVGETTLADEKKKRHFGPRMIYSVAIMCLGTLSYSYSAGVIANTLGQPSFYAYMELTTMSNESALIGATTSLYYAGGIFGAFAANFWADRWGRKASIYCGAGLTMVAAALCAGSVHIAMFIVFRFVSGFGGFMLLMTVPLWITEVVPPEVRGAFAQCHGVCISLGYFLSSYVGVGFYANHSIKGNDAWRGPLAIGALPPVLLLCGLWWVPESPRYLLMKQRTSQAWDIVRRFHTTPGNPDTRYAEMEMFQMKNQIELDRTLPHSWVYLFKTASMRKRMMMTFFIPFAVLSTGNLCIATYATIIIAHTGWDAFVQLNIQAGMMATVMPFIFAAIFFTEKLRRPTLVMTGLVMSCIVLSCYTAVSASIDLSLASNRSAQIASVFLLYLFQIMSASFLEGPLSYWAAEFYPTHLRARGQTIVVVGYGAFSLLWGQSAPTAIASLGWKLFLIFICLTAFSAVVIFCFYPDTQGKSLEDVALLFGDDDLVVVRAADIHVDANHHVMGILRNDKESHAVVENLEDIGDSKVPV